MVRFAPFLPKDWPWLLGLSIILAVLPLGLKNDYVLFLLNVIALNSVVVLGLNVLIGAAGQISLGHAAFYGMGAYISAIASTTWHWPLAAALVFAVAAVAVTSFLVAIPTLRLEGHYLVMATLGFNIIVTILIIQLEPVTGGPSGFPGIPCISLGTWELNSDRRFYFFIWLVFVTLLAVTLNLSDSRMGRALQAIHEKDITAQTLGIPSHRYKVMVFVLSAVYAAIAGFCYAHYVSFISPKTFDIFYSVQVVTMVVVGGMGSLWGGLAGTVLLTCLPEWLHRLEDLHVLLYGLILMAVLVYCPQGLMPAVFTSLTAFHRRQTARTEAASAPALPVASLHLADRLQSRTGSDMLVEVTGGQQRLDENSASCDTVMDLQGISLAFGGLQALQEVSLAVRHQEVVALIGPNGAGKTTLLNIISGLLKPQAGSIQLRGRTLLGLSPDSVAASGVGRTFQTAQVYQKLTVLENVLLGYHFWGRSGVAATLLHTPGERREEKRQREAALELLDLLGMSHKANWAARQLSLVEQKLVELARALALAPRLVLLDEPVGGLNPRESRVLMEFIGRLRELGIGILVVEHDMDFVMRLADRVVVLNHGARIAVGTPREIQQNPLVITAYLGHRK
jgi:branched-chain amino acid transport system permease protein